MNWISKFDWLLIFSWMLLTVIGLTAIYSATQGPVAAFLPEFIQDNFYKQSMWVFISLIIIIACQFTAPRTFAQVSYIFYAFGLSLVVYTLFFGTEVNGAKSWIRLMGMSFQVSELMKVGVVLAVANYLSNQKNIGDENLRAAFISLLFIVIPGVLVLLQNDTGTALVIFSITPFILFWSGLPYGISLYFISPAIIGYFAVLDWKWGVLAGLIITGIIFLVQKRPWLTAVSAITTAVIIGGLNLALNYVLQPYQRARIEAFANPDFDPHGMGWNALQAKTAVGSGGLFGKGFMEGTQTQLRFLPEQWTDFIFCVIGEEFGFIGSSLVIVLFLVLLLRLISGAGQHKNQYAQTVLVGVTSIFFIHLLINTGSALGLLPVIGIPLPFVSYGGSAFLSNSLMIGISLNLLTYKRDATI